MKVTRTQRTIALRLAVAFIDNVREGYRNKFSEFANDWVTRQADCEHLTNRQWAKVCRLAKIDIVALNYTN